MKAAVLDITTVPDDRYRSLCVTDIGRQHYPPRYSGAVDEGRMSKKMFKVKPSGHAAEPRKKVIPRPGPAPEKPTGKRVIPEQRYRRGQEISDPNALDVGWQHMRTVKQGLDQTGPPCNQRQSLEYNMEQDMNRKQRYATSGLPGDDPMYDSAVKYSMGRARDVAFKPRGRYRENNLNPEYSPGYYAAGGLIPGSSIQAHKSAKPAIRKTNEIGGGATGGKTMKTYKEIAAERELQYELDQVKYLTQATSKLGREVPSWEARTGFFLIKPEDEKD